MNSLSAQSSKKSFTFFNFGLGPSFPIGDFSETEFEQGSDDPGLADLGASFSFIDVNYLHEGNWGISGKLQAGIHKIDDENLTVEVTNRPTWKYVSILTGPILSSGLNEKNLSFDFRVLGGIMNSSSPAINTSQETNRTIKGTGIVYNVSLSIRKFNSAGRSLYASIDYINSKQRFKQSSLELEIKSISLSVGISFLAQNKN